MSVILLLSFLLSCDSAIDNQNKPKPNQNARILKQVIKTNMENYKSDNAGPQSGITNAQALSLAIEDLHKLSLKIYSFRKCEITTTVVIEIMEQLLAQIQKGLENIKTKISEAQYKVFDDKIKKIQKYSGQKNALEGASQNFYLSRQDYTFLYEYMQKYNTKLDNKTMQLFKDQYIKHIFIYKGFIILRPTTNPYERHYISAPLTAIESNFLLENLDYVKEFYRGLDESKYTNFIKKVPYRWVARLSLIPFSFLLCVMAISIHLISPAHIYYILNRAFLPILLFSKLLSYFVVCGFIKYYNKKALMEWEGQIQEWGSNKMKK